MTWKSELEKELENLYRRFAKKRFGKILLVKDTNKLFQKYSGKHSVAEVGEEMIAATKRIKERIKEEKK